SPGGDLFASASSDGTIRVWKLPGWRELRPLRGHTAAVRGLAFGPGGELLASGSDDWTVRVWRPGRGEELAALRGHTGRVSGGGARARGARPHPRGFRGDAKGGGGGRPGGHARGGALPAQGAAGAGLAPPPLPTRGCPARLNRPPCSASPRRWGPWRPCRSTG